MAINMNVQSEVIAIDFNLIAIIVFVWLDKINKRIKTEKEIRTDTDSALCLSEQRCGIAGICFALYRSRYSDNETPPFTCNSGNDRFQLRIVSAATTQF
jgi:hypothetical protein